MLLLWLPEGEIMNYCQLLLLLLQMLEGKMRNFCELLLLLLLLLWMQLWLLEGRDNELLSVVAAAAMAVGREDEELMSVVAGFGLVDAVFDAGRGYGIATNCYWCCCSHNCSSWISFTVDLTDAVLRLQYVVALYLSVCVAKILVSHRVAVQIVAVHTVIALIIISLYTVQ